MASAYTYQQAEFAHTYDVLFRGAVIGRVWQSVASCNRPTGRWYLTLHGVDKWHKSYPTARDAMHHIVALHKDGKL